MSTITLTINGRQVEAQKDQTVLQAALAAGIYIPTMCSHPLLESQGGCKLCVVEIDGDANQPVTSCTTPVRAGMQVVTKSTLLDEVRRSNMELMLAAHPHDCTGCRSYGNCELQAMMQYLSVSHARLKSIDRVTSQINRVNPLIDREMERCIACGRCVRICKDVRGVGILDYKKAQGETYIGTKDDLPLDAADCRFCGACIAVCPTGALQDREGIHRKDLARELSLVPCRGECPNHIDIPTYIRFVHEGKCDEAVATIREKAPFPHTLGHACSRFCETGCKRTGLNDPVSIRNIKRYAAENDHTQIWKTRSVQLPDTGKRVAVVGSGPCGLTAAYFLRRKGHRVTVLERDSVAGGMLSIGIPHYRLPQKDVQKEIQQIADTGVKIRTNSPVTSLERLLQQGYDAVLVATGAGMGRRLRLDGSNEAQTTTAVEFLRRYALGEDLSQFHQGTRVVVMGGGNVAFDAARSARRLGAQVSLVCLEDDDQMLADPEEIQQGREEGIHIYSGESALCFETQDERITGLKTIHVASFCFEEGNLHMETVPGTEKLIPADLVIFATGQRQDLPLGFGLALEKSGAPLQRDGRTDKEGVFVAGDVVTGTKSIIHAIAAGRLVARQMDQYLGGDGQVEEVLARREVLSPLIGKIQGFADIPRQHPHKVSLEKRLEGVLVSAGLDQEQAGCEAGRCLQCDLRLDIPAVPLWNTYH